MALPLQHCLTFHIHFINYRNTLLILLYKVWHQGFKCCINDTLLLKKTAKCNYLSSRKMFPTHNNKCTCTVCNIFFVSTCIILLFFFYLRSKRFVNRTFKKVLVLIACSIYKCRLLKYNCYPTTYFLWISVRKKNPTKIWAFFLTLSSTNNYS